ncbi:hypothetical protein APHAL10511_002897 [Amanita phalloides]|nr:hypothetical protein APHAL10511_002897 [Amanita phalloides]
MLLLVGYISLLLLVTGSQATTTDSATDNTTTDGAIDSTATNTATDKVAEFVDPVMRVNKAGAIASISEHAAPCMASVVVLVAVVEIISSALHRDAAVGTANSPVTPSDVATPARVVAEVELVVVLVSTVC